MSAAPTGLLRAARDCKNKSAWLRLVRLCEPLLHGWLSRQGVQHADAEDLIGETLSVVARELPAFRHNGHPGAFRCWLRRILVNRLRTFRRARRVRSICRPDSALLDRLADVLAEPVSDPSGQERDEHDRCVVREMMERIETAFQPQTWQVFRRTALEGADPALVAGELNLSLESVYAAKSRVLRRLRQLAAVFPD
jgi:RNA polymerase sigma-70 factor (ECF subfamily)